MKLTAQGTPGHGSLPRADNPVAILCAAVARLSQARLPQHRTATVERLVRSLAATQRSPASLRLSLVLNPFLERPLLQRMASSLSERQLLSE